MDKSSLDLLELSQIIKASAGSGKTYQLTQRIISLLFCGVAPKEILATTFTKKAAAEIEERVFKELVERFDKSSGKEREELKQQIVALCSNFDTIKIQTLDSFFIEIAQSHSDKLGLRPKISILNHSQEVALKNEAIFSLLEQTDNNQILQQLNYTKSNKKVLAGLNELIKILQEDSERYLNNIGITWGFESEKYNNIEQSSLYSNAEGEEFINKLVSFLESDEFPENKTGGKDKRFITALEKLMLAIKTNNLLKLEGLFRNGLKNGKYYDVEIPNSLCDIFKSFVEIMRPKLIKRINQKTLSYHKLVETLSGFLRSKKISANKLNFGDIKSVISNSELTADFSELYRRLDNRFSHVLLDEFQDTSYIEWKILRPLIDEIFSKETDGLKKSFFCVGDPKQSIYGWRGGESDLINVLERLYPNAELSSLDETRRCSKAVTDFVNYLFDNLAKNNSLTEYETACEKFKINFNHHMTTSLQEGFVSVEFLDKEKANASNKDLEQEADQNEEEDVIATNVLVRASEILNRIVLNDKTSTIGILFQKNSTIKQFSRYLNSKKFSEQFSDESAFNIDSSKEIVVLEAILKLLDHDGDSIAKTIVESFDKVNHGLLLEGKAVYDFIYDCKISIHTVGFSSFINTLVNKIYRNKSRESENIILASLKYEPQFISRAYDFYEYLKALKSTDSKVSRIRLLTIHGSKGLEFDYVILPELDESLASSFSRNRLIFGHDNQFNPIIITNPDDLTKTVVTEIGNIYDSAINQFIFESLCKLYVAITRARKNLYIIATRKLDPKKQNALTLGKVIESAVAPEVSWQIGAEDLTGKVNDKIKELNVKNNLLNNSSKITFKKRSKPVIFHEAPSTKDKKFNLSLKDYFSSDKDKTSYGITVHKELEKIKWLEDFEELNYENLKSVEKYLLDSRINQIFTKDYYQDWITNKEVDRLEVATERKFSLIENLKEDNTDKESLDSLRLVTGSFDRIVVGSFEGVVKAVEIIDFKTDKISEDNIKERAISYKKQCETYKWAASEIYKVDVSMVVVKLVFLEQGKVVIEGVDF